VRRGKKREGKKKIGWEINVESTGIFGYGCLLLWLAFAAAEDCIENCSASITSLSQLGASAPLIRHSLTWQQASFS
jgi:hypothetical protein